MIRNYFEVNGKQYYTGTVFVLNHIGKQTEATFIAYNVDREMFVYKIQEQTWRSPGPLFWKQFITVTDRKNEIMRMPAVKIRKDSDIDGLFIGWLWYIFLMLISVIFKDAIGLWILISVVFFGWRAKKIKGEGTYIEW